MEEKDLHFNPEYDFAKGGKINDGKKFLKNKGFREVEDVLFDYKDEGFEATQGIKREGLLSGFVVGIYYYTNDIESISKGMLNHIINSYGSKDFIYLYTNAGVDLHSSKLGKYKNLQVIRLKSYDYAKGGFIQEAVKEMKEKGTTGSFTKQAKNAGMSTTDFAKEVLKNPKKFTEKTRKRAMFMKNTNPKKFDVGGEIVRAYDVNINSGVGTYARGGNTKRKYYTYDISRNSKVLIYQQDREDENSFDSVDQIIRQLKKEGYKEKDFVVLKKDGKFARGGKMQGYNAQLDESLGMRRGAKRTKQQSDKDRRDEAKAMNKAMGRRAYASVRGMDKGRRMMAKGGDVTKKEYYERMTKKLGKQGAFERIIKDSQFGRRKGTIIYTHNRLPYSASIYKSDGQDKIIISKFNDKTGRTTTKGFDDPQELAAYLDKRKIFATGGKINRVGDVDFPEQYMDFAKGGKITIKDIEKSWDKMYGEEFKNEYSGLYKELKKEKDLTPRKLDKLWDENYGEDFKYEYYGVYEDLGGTYTKDEQEILDEYYKYAKGGKMPKTKMRFSGRK